VLRYRLFPAFRPLRARTAAYGCPDLKITPLAVLPAPPAHGPGKVKHPGGLDGSPVESSSATPQPAVAGPLAQGSPSVVLDITGRAGNVQNMAMRLVPYTGARRRIALFGGAHRRRERRNQYQGKDRDQCAHLHTPFSMVRLHPLQPKRVSLSEARHGRVAAWRCIALRRLLSLPMRQLRPLGQITPSKA
jgi:hypothetical protein